MIAPEGLRTILARERRERRREEGTTTSSSTTTTTIAPATAPFAVGTLSQTFIDPFRAAPARGGNPGASGRTLVTTVYYPVPRGSRPVPARRGTDR